MSQEQETFTVFTLCIDPERGKYLALAVSPDLFRPENGNGYEFAISHASEEEAIGNLCVDMCNSGAIATPLGQICRLGSDIQTREEHQRVQSLAAREVLKEKGCGV